MSPDFLPLLDAAYQVDVPQRAWFAGVCAGAARSLDRGLGVGVMIYDAADPTHVGIPEMTFAGAPRGYDARVIQRLVTGARDPGYVERTFKAVRCALVSQTPKVATRDEVFRYLARFGVGDVLGINAMDPSASGVFVGVNVPKGTRLRPATRDALERVAAHLSAGFRLNKRISSMPAPLAAPDEADAVLEPSGKVADAKPRAASRASRRTLRDAAVALDRARARARQPSPEWKPLVDARWTLLDWFDRDGRRYVLARHNSPGVPPIERLSVRERQVVAYAAMGQLNKQIGYELGISTSTVGVLLSRAASKLGVSGRRALVLAFLAEIERNR